MKRLTLDSFLGVAMDLDKFKLIVPTTATRSLELAGGAYMQQAVPEDYTLASLLLRTLKAREGEDIEFMIKAYLPAYLWSLPEKNECIVVELLGVASTKLLSFGLHDLESVIEEIASSSSVEALTKSIDSASKALISLAKTKEATHIGLLMESLAGGISDILDWPSTSIVEPYALLLESALKDSDLTSVRENIQALDSVVENVEGQMVKLSDTIDARTLEILKSKDSAASGTTERLRSRIDTLERAVSNLQFKIQQLESREKSSKIKKELALVKKDLAAREKALTRDRERYDKMTSSARKASERIDARVKYLVEKMSRTRAVIQSQRGILDKVLVNTGSSEVPEGAAVLLIPILFVGLTEKKKLRIQVIPPMIARDAAVQVTRRRDFIDTLLPASRGVETLAELVSQRIKKDPGLRSLIRSHSKDSNLLALKSTRATILDGVNALIADGLARDSILRDVREFLSSVPEQELKRRATMKTPVIAGDEDLAKVRFHVQDSTGTPIEGAQLDLGLFVLRSDSNGISVTSLPKGNYDGVVKATNFHERKIEFVLRSTSDVVIPITLMELSQEERLSGAIDQLVGRAERLDKIRHRLWTAFEKHGDTLLSIPAYRGVLVELLQELGHDAESWIAKATRKKGMIKNLLKRDDRIEGLRRDILRIAENSRELGGIMLFSELLVRLDNLGWDVTKKEVESLLRSMTKEGLFPGLTDVDSGTRLVEFIPVELTDDPHQVLELAASREGRLTIEDIVVSLDWTEERVNNAMDLLVERGVAKLQKSYSSSTQYWFPGFRRKK
jgi:hypothetical protein